MTSETKARRYVHRAESGHALVASLAAVLAEQPDDPFVPDLIAVPTQGIERWLAQQLSHHLGAGAPGKGDGVCANVAFPHPNDILDQAVAATSPEHAQSVQDWHPARTVWPLIDLLADIATGTDERYALLRHHLTTRQDTPTGRRYALGRRIATLFADYGASRPELIRAWAAGTPDDLPDDLAWQPLLWQSLREALGPSPAELLDDALAAIRAGTSAIDLPPRISVYGPSRLDASRVSVLAALATHRDVHLWLNHASPALWQQLRDQTPAATADRRRASNTARPVHHSRLNFLHVRDREAVLEAVNEALAEHFPESSCVDARSTDSGRYVSCVVTFGHPDLVPSRNVTTGLTGRPTLKRRSRSDINDLHVAALGSTVPATARQALTVASAADEDVCLFIETRPTTPARQAKHPALSLCCSSTDLHGIFLFRRPTPDMNDVCG